MAEFEVIKRVSDHEVGDVVEVPDGHTVDPYHYRPRHAMPETPETNIQGDSE
jgi:hypothetical protein